MSSSTVWAAVAASRSSSSISSISSALYSSSSKSSEVDRRLRLAVGAVEDLLLLALQPLGTAYEALVDRLRAGGQTALQHGEREADGVLALAAEPLGAVHPLADVVGDLLVQVVLQRGQLVGHGLGDALGEELLALEGEQVLLDHAAHDPLGVGGASVCLPSKRSRSSRARKSWKSSSLPECGVAVISRRWRVMLAEQLAELEALGLLELAAEVVRAHPVRLVDDDQVPLGLLELRLELARCGRAGPSGRSAAGWSRRR